ncbi:MAG: SDR family oxidoreductase [Ignavibacteria bacterium]|nr:SDR family oxidoreductase [Ignavibacteria bacterium]
MKVQIFGSNGYIGKNFTHFLSSSGVNLELFDIQETSFHSDIKYTQTDISDKAQISKINFESDFIVIFSGLTGTSIGFQKYEEYLKVNELGLLNILDEFRKQNYSGRIIFPSTRLVYKGIKDTPLEEDSEKEFKTPYAMNKYACENYIKMYNNLYGLNFTIFRICVPYGNLAGNDYSYGTVGFFLNKALKKENITLFGDGSQKRTFTEISDLCRVLLSGMQSEKTLNGIFNIGGETFSLYEAAKIVSEKFNVGIDLIDWPETDIKLESGDTIFNSDKLDAKLNYEYKGNFKKWVSELK